MEYFPNFVFVSTPNVGAEFLVDGSMFLRTPCVGAACICGCTWSWSWKHDNLLNKGQQDLTKLNAITSSICRRFWTCGRNLNIIEEQAIQILILQNKSQVLCIREQGSFSSNYITYSNYLDSMGSLWWIVHKFRNISEE